MYLKYEGLINDLATLFCQCNGHRDLKVIGIQIASTVDTETQHPTETHVEVVFEDLSLPKQYQRHVSRFIVPWLIQSRQCQLDFRAVDFTLTK